MVTARLRQARHAVVAVAQDLNAQAVVIVRQLVEAPEELVEESDELLRRALRRQDCEAHDVREDHANILVSLDVDLVELSLHGFDDVGLHFHGHVLWQHRQQQPLQFVIFILHVQSGGDAVACVQEGLALRRLHHLVQPHARHVHGRRHHAVGHQLLPVDVREGVGERGRQGGLAGRQHDAVGEGQRRGDGREGVDEERHEGRVPDALAGRRAGLPAHPAPARGQGEGQGDQDGAEGQQQVAGGQQVRVPHDARVQHDQQRGQHHRQGQQGDGRGRRDLGVGHVQSRQQERQRQQEGGGCSHARLLQLESVAAVEVLELVILEAVAVAEPGEGHLPVRRHGLHAVVHPDGASLSTYTAPALLPARACSSTSSHLVGEIPCRRWLYYPINK